MARLVTASGGGVPSRLGILIRLQLIIAWRPAKRGKIPEYLAIGFVAVLLGALALGLAAISFFTLLNLSDAAAGGPRIMLIGGCALFLAYLFIGLFQEGVGGGVDLSLLFHMPVSPGEMTRADLLSRLISPWALPPLGFFAGCIAGVMARGHFLFGCAIFPAAMLWYLQTFLTLMVGDLLLYHLRRSRRFVEMMGFLAMLAFMSWVVLQNTVLVRSSADGGGHRLIKMLADYWDGARYLVSLLPGASALSWTAWGWYAPVVLAAAVGTVAGLYGLSGFLLRRLMEEGTAKTARRRGAPTVRRALKRPGLIERLPMWPFILRDFRYLSRDPYLKTMVLGMVMGPVIILAVLAGPGGRLGMHFLHYGAPFLLLMYCSQLSNNHLGLERAGLLNTLVSPVPRWRLLLGKNMVLMAFYLLLMCLPVGLLVWRKASAFDIASDVVLAVALAPIYFGLGNFLSILMPVPMAPKGKRLRAQVPMGRMFMLAIAQIVLLGLAGLAAAPLFLGRFALSYLGGGAWLAEVAGGAMILYGLLIYALLLGGATRLMPRREPDIYEAVLRSES